MGARNLPGELCKLISYFVEFIEGVCGAGRALEF